ncbi:MAG: 30S ribosomal protein S8 [Waddliaceae bacterium]|jgi:small subunit ribosomal protein S8|nr:30S ribosomal protein S8 [Waddliaceae bacterium]MBT3578647.1 30S ribosomal protein S8 [Waddliaceae bacterium]MBT4445366.1 30S ribosomal protein S8 [Waddliaceae bacterium]MBT6928366.1 30S ribosomal protein S8 [Waddliaceae bacterium]MBT7265052.1 30S ribosomal protein S8 [Waddliaceae bacterium]
MSAINDPIADLFTRIRNGLKAEHRYIDVDRSKFKVAIVKLLKEQGYIENFITKDLDDNGRGIMRVFLKYASGRLPVIQGIKRVSRPGLHIYADHKNVPRVFGGMGMAIMSTSHGVMSGQEARKRKIGGEHVGNIW